MLKVDNHLNQSITSIVGCQEYAADKKRRLGVEGAKPISR